MTHYPDKAPLSFGECETASHPLGAQVAANYMVRSVADYPGVRDVDNHAGLVTLEDGRSMSVKAFFGQQAEMLLVEASREA